MATPKASSRLAVLEQKNAQLVALNETYHKLVIELQDNLAKQNHELTHYIQTVRSQQFVINMFVRDIREKQLEEKKFSKDVLNLAE